MAERKRKPWYRVQADVDENEKTIPLSDAAFRVWMCSLAYSKRTQSRGFVPEKKAIQLAAVTDEVTCDKRVTGDVTGELTRAGLWSEVDGGFSLTSWKKHQTDPAERTDEQRDADAQRKRDQRERERNVTDVTLTSPVSKSLPVENTASREDRAAARAAEIREELGEKATA